MRQLRGGGGAVDVLKSHFLSRWIRLWIYPSKEENILKCKHFVLILAEMSTTKTLADRIQEEKERFKKRLEQLESAELQRMIDEYEDGSKRLAILKEKIELVLGSPLQETPFPKERVKGKGNRPKVTPEDVFKGMVALLKDHPEGLKKKEIAEHLNVGQPKVDEAFALGGTQFEPRMRGPKAVIKLKG